MDCYNFHKNWQWPLHRAVVEGHSTLVQNLLGFQPLKLSQANFNSPPRRLSILHLTSKDLEAAREDMNRASGLRVSPEDLVACTEMPEAEYLNWKEKQRSKNCWKDLVLSLTTFKENLSLTARDSWYLMDNRQKDFMKQKNVEGSSEAEGVQYVVYIGVKFHPQSFRSMGPWLAYLVKGRCFLLWNLGRNTIPIAQSSLKHLDFPAYLPSIYL